MQVQDIVRLLQASIEASVYVAPTDPGLTIEELQQIGQRLDLKQGEINDALHQFVLQRFGVANSRVMLDHNFWQMSSSLALPEQPELRNATAFDFVVAQLNGLAREVGAANARIERAIVSARAKERGIPTHDLEVAITLMLLSGQLSEEKGTLRFPSGQRGERALPSAGTNQIGVPHHSLNKSNRTLVMPHVKDVIDRRSDGRPKSIEPFGAFTEQLEKLGYGYFRLWWIQISGELRRSEDNSSPVSALILAAALVEATLTFVVKHARSQNLGVFGSKHFERDPRTWKIDDLVESAARGGDSAILDGKARARADELIRNRQRIHAGRLLTDFPKGIPDLRPEEARDAKASAEQVVRRVLDWLERFPPQ